MNTMSKTLSVLVLGLVMAACNKPPEPRTAAANATTASATTASATTATESVAMPANKLPASDASIAPNSSSGGSGASAGDAGAAGSGNAGGPSQQRPKDLAKSEEESKLPLSGQVNNHSMPDTTEQKTEPKK